LLIHIDEMMNHDSGTSVKADTGSAKAKRKDRHKMTEMVTKAKLKAANHQIEVRQINDRKWEAGGKSPMAKWLRSGSNGESGIISSNGNRNSSSRSSSSGNVQQQLRPFPAAASAAAPATARKRGKKKAGSVTKGRDWEKDAKTTLGNWLKTGSNGGSSCNNSSGSRDDRSNSNSSNSSSSSSSISKRGNRQENPDRDKEDS
jgi:hypothetical protein